MTPWKKELDALIEQTMAMAKNVKGLSVQTKPALERPEPAPEPSVPSVERVLDTDGQRPEPASMLTVRASERNAIQQRVASFKAHQQKVQSERDEYFARTMSQARTTIADQPRTPPKN